MGVLTPRQIFEVRLTVTKLVTMLEARSWKNSQQMKGFRKSGFDWFDKLTITTRLAKDER